MPLVRPYYLQILYGGEEEMNCPICGAPMDYEKEDGEWLWMCTECGYEELDEVDDDED